jgi:hypothetical protein
MRDGSRTEYKISCQYFSAPEVNRGFLVFLPGWLIGHVPLPLFAEDQFDRNFIKAELFADLIHQVAFVGKVDASGMRDKCLMVTA